MKIKSNKVKALFLESFGSPEKGIVLKEFELPPLQENDVLVRMKAAAINPSDIATIQGRYGIKPDLPFLLGWEGAGIVEAVGSSVRHLKVGQHVIAPSKPGTWCEAYVTDAKEIIVLPDELPFEQCAMMGVNPPTAWRILHDFVQLQPGDWILQNGANSAVGRAIIDIAHYKGLRTINVVRREDVVKELEESGGTIVVVEEKDKPLAEIVRSKIGNDVIALGINCIGGRSGTELARTLTPHGSFVTYGAMSGEPMQVDNGLLIYQDIRFYGFWRTAWFKHTSPEMRDALFFALSTLALQGYFKTPIEKTYPLEDFKAALQHTTQTHRKGKILFTM